MRESQARSTDQENSEKDFKVNRTHRLKKYREARKLKGTSASQNNTEDYKAVNREEKMEIKKLRNREAAQRARDKAKLHVESLEEELEGLKQQIVVLKNRQFICIKCSQSCSLTEPVQETKSMQMKEEAFFQQESIEELQPFFEVERVKSTKSFSYPMFFMILAVVLCIAVGVRDGQTQIRRPHRLLQEVVNISHQDGFENMKTNVYPHKQHYHQLVDPLLISIPEEQQIKELNISKKEIPSKIEIKQDFMESRSNVNLSSSNETKQGIFQTVISKDGKYDVLYCDSSRIYRMDNQKNTLLEGQFKLLINRDNLESNQQLSDIERTTDPYEVLVKVISVKSPHPSWNY